MTSTGHHSTMRPRLVIKDLDVATPWTFWRKYGLKYVKLLTVQITSDDIDYVVWKILKVHVSREDEEETLHPLSRATSQV